MANPKSWGRMIRRDISKSKSFASLAQVSKVLFMMLIPHFSSHGKLNGHPAFIKGEIVPLLDEYDLKTIEKCLKEISEKTNVKWFKHNELMYLHAINWHEHQELNATRLGRDDLPDYKSCDSLAQVLHKSIANINDNDNGNSNDNDNGNVNVNSEKRKKHSEFIAPSQDEFIEYFKANGYKTDIALRAFKGYSESGWKDSQGKPVLNWKQKCQHVWFKPEHKSKVDNRTQEEIVEQYRKEGWNVVDY